MTYGSQWSALLGDTEQIPEILDEAIREGQCIWPKNIYELPDAEGNVGVCRVLVIDHPGDAVIQSRLICSRRENADHGNVEFGFPFLGGGMPNLLTIREIHEAGSALEAVLECSTPGGATIKLFDPYFQMLSDVYQVESTVEFVIAGLSYVLRKAEQESITITEGPMVELRRQDALKEDPDADVSAITSVEICLKGCTMLIPREETGDAEIRATVLDITWHEVRGVRMAKITVLFRGGQDSGGTVFPIYASEHVLNGYDPIPGDDIEGVVWMQGYPSWYAQGGAYSSNQKLQPVADEFARAMNTMDQPLLESLLHDHVEYRSEQAGEPRVGKAAVVEYLTGRWAKCLEEKCQTYAEIGWQCGDTGKSLCILLHAHEPDNLVAVFRLGFEEGMVSQIDVSYKPEDRRLLRRSGTYPR